MVVYHLPHGRSFTKTVVKQGQGLAAPNEGSACQVLLQCLGSSPTDKLCKDLLPFGEPLSIYLGFYSTPISYYVHRCLITTKADEVSTIRIEMPDQHPSIELSVHLIAFQRFPEIYAMSIDQLYTFALEHKENANKFFQEKEYSHAFDLYHRSLCYVLNFINEEPSDEHQTYLEKFNQLILSIYSNMSACQLICGNYSAVIENCSSALEIDPMYVKALYRRGSAHAHLNDYEVALKDLLLAQKIQPNDKSIEELLKQTRQRLEQYQKTLANSLKNLF